MYAADRNLTCVYAVSNRISGVYAVCKPYKLSTPPWAVFKKPRNIQGRRVGEGWPGRCAACLAGRERQPPPSAAARAGASALKTGGKVGRHHFQPRRGAHRGAGRGGASGDPRASLGGRVGVLAVPLAARQVFKTGEDSMVFGFPPERPRGAGRMQDLGRPNAPQCCPGASGAASAPAAACFRFKNRIRANERGGQVRLEGGGLRRMSLRIPLCCARVSLHAPRCVPGRRARP